MALIGGFLLFVLFIGMIAAGSPIQKLSNRFAKLGSLQGMTYEQIIRKVGPANSVTNHDDGPVYEWIAVRGVESRYHVILKFDNEGYFVRVIQETMI